MTHGFTRHARRKMHELGLSVDDVLAIIDTGDIVEQYEQRTGMLLYGLVRGREIHVSVVVRSGPVTLVTTVYAVDQAIFPDGRTPRGQR